MITVTKKGMIVEITSNNVTSTTIPLTGKANEYAQEIARMAKNPKWIEYLTKFDDNSHSQNGKKNKKLYSQYGRGGSKKKD